MVDGIFNGRARYKVTKIVIYLFKIVQNKKYVRVWNFSRTSFWIHSEFKKKRCHTLQTSELYENQKDSQSLYKINVDHFKFSL